MTENNNSKDTIHIVSVLFRLAVRYPEVAIIISVMLLLLLPLTVVSQATDGQGFVYFAMFFLFSVIAIAIVYTAKGFISAITHSAALKILSTWCVGLTVLSITVSLGISVSALLLSQIFPNFQNGLISDISKFAVSVFVEKDESVPVDELPQTLIPDPNNESLSLEGKAETVKADKKIRDTTRLLITDSNYKSCLGNAKSETDIEFCIDKFK